MENTIAPLCVLSIGGYQGLLKVLPIVMNHASALAFLMILMILVPCAATITVMKPPSRMHDPLDKGFFVNISRPKSDVWH